MKKIFCNRCGDDCTSDSYPIVSDQIYFIKEKSFGADFCKKCFEDFKWWSNIE